MDLGITGRIAAVPAASAGLGLAVATALAAEGVRVAMCGRGEARLNGAAQRLGAVPLIADVSTVEGAERFLDMVDDKVGPPDILVLNGGGPPPGDAVAAPLESYADALQGTALPAIAMCRAAVPGMADRHWGRVLAISSITVKQPIPELVPSTTARAALTGYLKSTATAYAAHGVTVNSLQAGLHSTDRLVQVYGEHLEMESRAIPAQTLGRPADFGAVAAFLCSEHARFITGASIPVDGGSNRGLM
ncbi:SDR family oxidoreductase [Actinophytocola sp.]|uniref:SDR family oxidoreductase n=1 Tax=Actinophytocola sp. TaxID=1872138 RepID=UPI003D6BB1E0